MSYLSYKIPNSALSFCMCLPESVGASDPEPDPEWIRLFGVGSSKDQNEQNGDKNDESCHDKEISLGWNFSWIFDILHSKKNCCKYLARKTLVLICYLA
jgi:hypothetical protein